MYPSMGGYHSHASGCDPENFGEDKGGRPSAWAKENPASGTRVADDPKQRSKFLIQWREGGSAHRLWLPAPTDQELVTTKYRWYSIREPTASGTSSSSQQVVKEETETEDKSESPGPPRSKRYNRAQRQHNVREVFQVFHHGSGRGCCEEESVFVFWCPQ